MITTVVVTDVDSPNSDRLWEDLAPLVDAIGTEYDKTTRTLTVHVEDMRGATKAAVRALAKTHAPAGLSVAQQAREDRHVRLDAAQATFPTTVAGKDALLKDLLDVEVERRGPG